MALPNGGVACGSQAASGSWPRGALAVQLRSPTGDGEHHSTSFGTPMPSPAASVLPPLWPSPACLHPGPSRVTLSPQSSLQVDVAFPLKPLELVATLYCQKQQYSTQVPRPLLPHTKLQVASYAQQAYT